MRRFVAFAASAFLSASAVAQGGGAKVYAAGSLRAAFEQASTAFSAYRAGAVTFEFGPSATLKDRLLKGDAADVFASANMEDPQALAQAGKSNAVRRFARDRLCALAPASLGVTPENLLDRMLDEKTKLGTSTPKADPSGDYAWEVFRKAEALRPGSKARLEKKALQLVGGPNAPKAPPKGTIYGVLVAERKADIFLTSCTNAILSQKEEPKLATIPLPEALAVGADHGIVAMKGASPTGNAFVEFLLGPEGQRILANAGFSPP